MNDIPVFTDKNCTELRQAFVAQNNAAVESESPDAERKRLDAKHGTGNVWNSDELRAQFEVHSFLAPFCFVTRRSDKRRGVLEFQHSPRFYFDFSAR